MHEFDGLDMHLKHIESLLGGDEDPVTAAGPNSNDTDGLGQHLEYIEELLEGGGGGTSVEANVPVTGEEDTLANIKIGDETYLVKTWQKFPSDWVTDGTVKQFLDSVDEDQTAVEGMGFLGDLTCTNLPEDMVNAETVVEITKSAADGSKVIHITITSGNKAPYRWERTYWNHGQSLSGWISFLNTDDVQANPVLQGSENDLTAIKIKGTKYTIPASGVREVSTGVTDGTINVNTGGIESEVAVAGLQSGAFTDADTKVDKISAASKVYGTDENGNQTAYPITVEESRVVYGFHINGSESNPSNAVTYLRDAIGMTPAYMDYASDQFNYGSWKNAFFMPKPCMVKYDGTTDYYLNENNYAYKEDGSASDVADDSYAGNAMMEWGANGMIWYKIVPDENDTKSASIYIANYKEDDDYVNYSFINNEGNVVDRFYTPIYTGWNDSTGRMRSISGKAPLTSTTASQEITASKKNNPTGSNMWYTEVFADIQLINFLLILISKSLDSQTAFGQGYTEGGSSDSSLHNSGTCNDKGLFYGSTSTSQSVKVFGMENWWGNHWRRYAGHIVVSGSQRIKMTYGTQDGSTASAYNTDGTGYIVKGVTPTGTSGGYLDQMTFDAQCGLPKNASGSSSTYYCDGLWLKNSITSYALRGGHCAYGSLDGLFCASLNLDASGTYWSLGSALSCKPLRNQNKLAMKNYVDIEDAKKLDKVTTANVVYGTDGSGDQTTYDFTFANLTTDLDYVMED